MDVESPYHVYDYENRRVLTGALSKEAAVEMAKTWTLWLADPERTFRKTEVVTSQEGEDGSFCVGWAYSAELEELGMASATITYCYTVSPLAVRVP